MYFEFPFERLGVKTETGALARVVTDIYVIHPSFFLKIEIHIHLKINVVILSKFVTLFSSMFRCRSGLGFSFNF